MATPAVSYRVALNQDARAMIGVHHAAVQAAGFAHYSSEVVAAWSPFPDEQRTIWLGNLISQGTTLCTLAQSSKGEVVGFCIAIPEDGLLKALYVHPDYSGVGIGQQLLLNIEAQCFSAGIEALEVKASYNAENFYRRVGYEPLGPTTQPLTESVSMAAIRMVKRISGTK